MITNTVAWLSWSLLVMAMLWMMKNQKIKVIFGEIRKTLQILPLTKIAQAFMAYWRNKNKPER